MIFAKLTVLSVALVTIVLAMTKLSATPGTTPAPGTTPGTTAALGSTPGTPPAPSAIAEDNPVELGRITWHRDLETAKRLSREQGKPIFLVFQEIPGCSTCVNFGEQVLSHPLLVEAIESEFIPLAIHNNKPGADAEALKQFDEPSWNNPVVRFVDNTGADVIARKDGVWTTGAMAQRAVKALESASRPVPAYLSLAAAELTPKTKKKATFAMHCYWEGEAKLGNLDGVLGTRAGWLDGREVVEVVYDAEAIGYGDLLAHAQSMECASWVYTHDEEQAKIAGEAVKDRAAALDRPAKDAKASDQKFALTNTSMRYLPLTPLQATKVNASIRLGDDPGTWLSPRQKRLLVRITDVLAKHPDALKQLARPNSIDTLDEYESKLRATLETVLAADATTL